MECMTISDICVPENTSLWSLYFNVDDAVAYDYVWRICNTSKHNRIITDDYGKLSCVESVEIDGYEVVSAYIDHDFLVVKVYVKPVKEEE